MPQAIERLFATPMMSPVFSFSSMRDSILAPMSNDRQELAEIIRRKSLRTGDFTLSSGKKASYYLDCRMTTLDPRGAMLVARLMLDKIAALNIRADAIGGLTLGADPIAASVAVVSGIEGKPLPAFIVRKESKG